MRDGKIATVHGVSQQRLWMECIGHVQTVPPTIDAIKENVFRFRKNPDGVEYSRKRNAGPFRYCGPTLLAHMLCDLRARWIAFQLRQSQLGRPRDQTISREPPFAETTKDVLPVQIAFRERRVDCRKILGDLIPPKLSRQRLPV